MKEPLISVIVPVYNTEKEARKLVEQILSSAALVEVLVVDDGSAEPVGKFDDQRVKVLRQENKGASAARNRGIKEARGDFVVFPDSDDMVRPGFLEKMLKEMTKPGTALVLTGVRYKKLAAGTAEDVCVKPFFRDFRGDLKTRVLESFLKDGRMYAVSNKMFRMDVVRELKFDEKMKYGEDTKFVLDYLARAEGAIREVSEPLYIYNYGTATSAAKKAEGDWQNWQKCYENLQKWVGTKATLRQKILLRLILTRWRISWWRRRNG